MRRATALFAGLLLALLVSAGVAVPESALFTAPVKVNAYGAGYEPSIDVDSQGTLYITAHKASNVVEGGRLSSWLWYSQDGGATWSEMPAPLQAHDKLFAFEGDLAVDALDRLYYVDTFLVDNTISRWSPGPVWDYSLPVQRSAGLDDRPWISAHGDGIVYYVGNNGAAIPAVETVADGSARMSRATFYRSTDGGLTWSAGWSVPFGGWCNVAASPQDDVTVHAVCISDISPPRVYAQSSSDRGETWTQKRVADLTGESTGFSSIAVDRAGNVYTAWADHEDGVGSKLVVARKIGAAWSVLDVTPFAGTIQKVWISAGSDGAVGLAYYATDSLDPDTDSKWRTYATISKDASSAAPAWTTTAVSGVVTESSRSPEHFLQGVVGPDDRFHVTFAVDIPAPDVLHTVDYNQDIYYTGQLLG